jgi:hypothetical protein
MGLPVKEYDRLHALGKHWGLPQDDVYYFVENGLLRACVWLPMRYMERGVIKNKKFIHQLHEHEEGFVGIRPEDFHRICSNGSARLRIFLSMKQQGHILRMAFEPPQPSVTVRIHDVIVLRQDKLAFEKLYDILATEPESPQQQIIAQQEFSSSPDYHHITLNGEEYHLGDVQANIVQQLHDAYRSRNQWVHGKILLSGASSKALRVRDVFKSKSDWNNIVASNGRGYYRLNLHEQKATLRAVAA